MHLGSLVAAVGSFLDAKSHGGRWLMRMEDLDTARVIPGCADTMLRTLEAFGLEWDGAIEFQSQRLTGYREALEKLSLLGLTFECSCSRRERALEGGYPGTCRAGPKRAGPTATRFRVADEFVSFADRVQGICGFSLPERGDVIVKRRDGTFAYQLAVVVDDAAQGVTDVVRGADLLDSTPWQLALQGALKLRVPRYAHLPLIVEPGGGKLSKSRRSVALDPQSAGPKLYEALTLLRQGPPAELELAPVADILAWGRRHWSLEGLATVKEVRLRT